MRIGVVIGRIGDVDGVALETEKWLHVLNEMGHDIYILSGRYKRSIISDDFQTCMAGLFFFFPEFGWGKNPGF